MESEPKIESTEDIDSQIKEKLAGLEEKLLSLSEEDKEVDELGFSPEGDIKHDIYTLETYKKMQERPFWKDVFKRIYDDKDKLIFITTLGGSVAGGASLRLNADPQQALAQGAVGALILGTLGFVLAMYEKYTDEKSIREAKERQTRYIIGTDNQSI